MAVLWFLAALFSTSGRDKVWEWTNNVIEWLNENLIVRSVYDGEIEHIFS